MYNQNGNNNQIDASQYNTNKDHSSEFFADYKPKKSSKQQVSNMKRLKELERTFGVNLDGDSRRQDSHGLTGSAADAGEQSLSNSKVYENLSSTKVDEVQIVGSAHKRLGSQQPPNSGNYNTAQITGGGNDHIPINLKNSNSLQINKQRSVAAKAGQMQIFAQQAQDSSSLMLKGSASQIGNSYESYLGRKQIIQQQRDRKEALLRQLETGRPAISGSPDTTNSPQNKRENASGGGQTRHPRRVDQDIPLKEIGNMQGLGVTGQSASIGTNLEIKSIGIAQSSHRPPIQNQNIGRTSGAGSVPGRQLLVEDMEVNGGAPPVQNRNRLNSHQNVHQNVQQSPDPNPTGHGLPNSVKSSQVLRHPNMLRSSNLNLQLSLRDAPQSNGAPAIDNPSQPLSHQVLSLPPSSGSNSGLLTGQTLASSGSHMRGPAPLALPKPMRLGSRQKAGQAPQQNQQFSSLLPPALKAQGATISSLDGAGRRRHIAALRTQQSQNEHLAYATGPAAISVAESSTALSLGGAPQYLSTNGFVEHLGLYTGGNQGSSSVHNLKGNHKIHHFRTGVAPLTNQAFGVGDSVNGNSVDMSAKSKVYASSRATNALTGVTAGQGPAFSITGDQLLRPSIPGSESNNWQGISGSQHSDGLRPQPDAFLQGQRLSPLVGSHDLAEQETPTREGELPAYQLEGNRSLLSQRPQPAHQQMPEQQEASAAKVPKTYDYLFVQMSNEQFTREYNNKKVHIQRPHKPSNEEEKHLQYQTQASQNWQQSPRGQGSNRGPMPTLGLGGKFGPASPLKAAQFGGATILSPQGEAPNLMGIVNVKAYERSYTNEVPAVTCHLLPTQLDHLKVLLCEEESRGQVKLTQDAAERCEIEKQAQVKQYMEDIIDKLKQKERKHKVTVKKKFIEDALATPTAARVASVYVLVVNREKNYDPIISQKIGQKLLQARRRPSEQTGNKQRTASVNTFQNGAESRETSSSEDEAEAKARLEHEKQEIMQNRRLMGGIRRSAYPSSNSKGASGKYCYDSDTNGAAKPGLDRMNSTTTSSTIPRLKKQSLADAGGLEQGALNKRKRSTGPASRPLKVDDVKFKWVPPVKVFPEKYGPTKIRIVQDCTAHRHHKEHKLNVFAAQYNEFIRIMFKNQKASAQSQKFNVNYASGLAKCLGLKVAKDAFSEQNLKSRDHLTQLKERLSFCFIKKVQDENKEIFPTPLQGAALTAKHALDADQSANENETIDSSFNTENNLSVKQEKSESNTKTTASKADAAGGADGQPTGVRNDGSVVYKYSIGKGNNSIMVRSLFKNRFWWMQSDKAEMDKVNFMWTQIKNTAHMEALLCKFPNQRSGVTSQNKAAQGGGLSGLGNLSTAHSSSKTVNAITSTPTSTSTKSNKKKKVPAIQSGDKPNGPNKAQAGTDKGSQQTQQQINFDNATKLLETKLYNKIEDNFHMANKKALLLNMKHYSDATNEDVFAGLPVTFHIKNGLDDPEFTRFKAYYDKAEEEIKTRKALKLKKRQEKLAADAEASQSPETSPEKTDRPKEAGLEGSEQQQKQRESKVGEVAEPAAPEYHQSSAPMKNIWILKPGENTNCGNGIQVARDFNEIVEIVTESNRNSRKRTCIVQKYIHSPLLIHRRKFDIRTYAMLTSVGGRVHGYVYEEGYIRTSSYEFDLSNLADRLVHLTNDSVQKRDKGYGKYEPGNKMSYNEFQHYLDRYHGELNVCFERDLLPQMNKLTTDIFRAVHGKADPKRRLNTFEVFGLDFMIDDEFKLYLIEVNTNPCLELSSPLLARLIPNMLENALKLAVDPLFQPPEHYSQKKAFVGDPCPENRFELIFDDSVDGPVIEAMRKTSDNVIVELDEEELSDEEELPDGDQPDADEQE